MSIVEGLDDPPLGRRALAYGEYRPSPVVQARTGGTSVRFTTVIVPRPPGRSGPIRVTGAEVTAGSVAATVDNQGHVESFVLTPESASIAPA